MTSMNIPPNTPKHIAATQEASKKAQIKNALAQMNLTGNTSSFSDVNSFKNKLIETIQNPNAGSSSTASASSSLSDPEGLSGGPQEDLVTILQNVAAKSSKEDVDILFSLTNKNASKAMGKSSATASLGSFLESLG